MISLNECDIFFEFVDLQRPYKKAIGDEGVDVKKNDILKMHVRQSGTNVHHDLEFRVTDVQNYKFIAKITGVVQYGDTPYHAEMTLHAKHQDDDYIHLCYPEKI